MNRNASICDVSAGQTAYFDAYEARFPLALSLVNYSTQLPHLFSLTRILADSCFIDESAKAWRTSKLKSSLKISVFSSSQTGRTSRAVFLEPDRSQTNMWGRAMKQVRRHSLPVNGPLRWFVYVIVVENVAFLS